MCGLIAHTLINERKLMCAEKEAIAKSHNVWTGRFSRSYKGAAFIEVEIDTLFGLYIPNSDFSLNSISLKC